MAKILEVSLKMQVNDDELSNLLARLGEGSVTAVSAVDTGTGEITEAAPAATAPAADAGDKPKGRGRPKKNPEAAPALAAPPMPTMPTTAPAGGMPGMPTMPTAPVAPPPISYETMAEAYGQKAAEGKLTAEMVVAKYVEIGLTDPNAQLLVDESARRKMYDWFLSL